MKRKNAVRKLKNILADWDSCLIDNRAASKILTRIQREIGMLPPDGNAHLPVPCEMVFEWDEKRK